MSGQRLSAVDELRRFVFDPEKLASIEELVACTDAIGDLRILIQVAEDVNAWLKRSQRGGTAHQRILESALLQIEAKGCPECGCHDGHSHKCSYVEQSA